MVTSAWHCRRCGALGPAGRHPPAGWWLIHRSWRNDVALRLGAVCGAVCLAHEFGGGTIATTEAEIATPPHVGDRRLTCAGCRAEHACEPDRAPVGWYLLFRVKDELTAIPMGRACSARCVLALLPRILAGDFAIEPRPDAIAALEDRRPALTPSEHRKARRRLAAERNTKDRACVDKMSYGEKAARRAAKILRSKGEDVHHYACPFGSHFHVGHTAYERDLRVRSQVPKDRGTDAEAW